jgi:sulfur-oxidizing protein SoxY
MHEIECNTMDPSRRHALKAGVGLGLFSLLVTLGLSPKSAWAGVDRKAFEAKTLNEALEALGVRAPSNSALIKLTAPEIAENGAVVPVTVESALPGTEQISILVDKNPTMLVNSFTFPQGTEGFITTRVRMAQTASVVVLVKAGGKFYRVSQEVKVTAGGC